MLLAVKFWRLIDPPLVSIQLRRRRTFVALRQITAFDTVAVVQATCSSVFKHAELGLDQMHTLS